MRLVLLPMLVASLFVGCGSDGTPPEGPAPADLRAAQRADLLVSADGGVYRVRGEKASLLFKAGERARWSRDGRLIARLEAGPEASDYGGRIPELIISRPDGSQRVRVRIPRDFAQRYQIDDYAWGPQQRLAIAAVVAGGEEPPQRLLLTGPGGTGRRELVRCREITAPAWSPDGRQIAYLCADGRAEIVGADGRGRRVVRKAEVPGDLILGGNPGAQATWRPDGRRLAIDGHEVDGGDERIVLLDPRSGRLTSGPIASSLSWSSDGGLIAYTPTSGRGGIVITDAAGRRLRHLRLQGAYDVQWRPR